MLTKENITFAKGRGFLLNRGTECFSGRLVSIGGQFTAETLTVISRCAAEFGNGNVIFTSRLSAEIQGIPFAKIPDAEAFVEAHGLSFGGTGAKIRPITACKGTTCVFGTIDTHGLAKELHERFYVGYRTVSLPHKFKIGVGGCPNSCMKPSLNDVGIEGNRSGCRIYVGGTWGRSQRIGTPLSVAVPEKEVADLVEKVILWYRENGYVKERLGAAIDRVGLAAFEDAIFHGDLLARRDEILSRELSVRP